MEKSPSHRGHAQPQTKRARILIADDHACVLAGIRSLLDPHYEIVGTVKDGQALLEAAPLLQPDLIILDINMPLLSGIEVATQLRKSGLATKLLFLTMHASPAYRHAAINAGGHGYVVKSSASEELLQAIESVLIGGVYISPAAR